MLVLRASWTYGVILDKADREVQVRSAALPLSLLLAFAFGALSCARATILPFALAFAFANYL